MIAPLATASACTEDRTPATAPASPAATPTPDSPTTAAVATPLPVTATATVPSPAVVPGPSTLSTAPPSPTPKPPSKMPMIGVSYEGLVSYGVRGSFCWPRPATSEGTVVMCADVVPWFGLDEPSITVLQGGSLTITVEADSPPTRVSVSVFEEGKQPPRFQGSPAIEEQLRLGPDSTVELQLNLDPGDYYMSVQGFWPAGDLGHQFKILVDHTL